MLLGAANLRRSHAGRAAGSGQRKRGTRGRAGSAPWTLSERERGNGDRWRVAGSALIYAHTPSRSVNTPNSPRQTHPAWRRQRGAPARFLRGGRSCDRRLPPRGAKCKRASAPGKTTGSRGPPASRTLIGLGHGAEPRAADLSSSCATGRLRREACLAPAVTPSTDSHSDTTVPDQLVWQIWHCSRPPLGQPMAAVSPEDGRARVSQQPGDPDEEVRGLPPARRRTRARARRARLLLTLAPPRRRVVAASVEAVLDRGRRTVRGSDPRIREVQQGTRPVEVPCGELGREQVPFAVHAREQVGGVPSCAYTRAADSPGRARPCGGRVVHAAAGAGRIRSPFWQPRCGRSIDASCRCATRWRPLRGGGDQACNLKRSM